MARQPKKGIDYAGWSVDIFDGDTKIDKLLDAQGWVGFGIYFFLCQMAYKFDGYFYRWSYDDSASTARRMGGGIRSETVKATVGACFQIGLFDKRLFEESAILTSRGIQKRFLAAIQGRRVKTVIADYWLLDDEESVALVKCVKNENLQPTNAYLQAENADLQPTNAYKEKKSKGNESKKDDAAKFGDDPDVSIVFTAYFEKIGDKMTERIKDELMTFLRSMGPECCIMAMDEAIEANKISWRYVRGVMEKKRAQGVRCAADWHAVEKRREEEQRGTGVSAGGNAAGDGGKAPKWKLEATEL